MSGRSSSDRARTSQCAGFDAAAVAAAVGAPDLVLPWLDRFYDSDDARLLATTATPTEGVAYAGARPVEPPPDADVERAIRRAVLLCDDDGLLRPAPFRERLEIWAMFEGWRDVPARVRREVATWELANYAETIREPLEALRDGRPTADPLARYTYLTLPEAEEAVVAAGRVYLWPCDCRTIVDGCGKLPYSCLRFGNDRRLGWEISPERAVEILRATDAAGLTHTGYLAGTGPEGAGICNCCADCCFPHLASERLGAVAVWPVRRHVADIAHRSCTACRRCAKRCPFAAIELDDDGRARVDAAACRGCGVCATGCDAGAITLRTLG